MNFGRCICCGGNVKFYWSERKKRKRIKKKFVEFTLPFVYIACGVADPRFKCDLYNISTKHCIVGKCIGFEDGPSVRKRVTFLFNLILVVRRMIQAHGECFVNKTRDAIDAIPILSLVGMKACELKYTGEYFIFFKEMPLKEKSDFIPIDYGRDEALKRINSMVGGDLILSMVKKMVKEK